MNVKLLFVTVLLFGQVSQAQNSDKSLIQKVFAGRKHLVGFALSANSIAVSEPSTSYYKNNIDFSLATGWNRYDIELGPKFVYGYSKSSVSEDKKYGIGGFIDINFVPNDGKAVLVHAMRTNGLAQVISYSSKTSMGTAWDANIGYAAKWFGLNTSWAVDFSLLYGFNLAHEDSGDTKVTGFKSQIGLQTYY